MLAIFGDFEASDKGKKLYETIHLLRHQLNHPHIFLITNARQFNDLNLRNVNELVKPGLYCALFKLKVHKYR